MAREPSTSNAYETGVPDRRVSTIFFDGAWSAAAGALVGFLILFIKGSQTVQPSAAAVDALWVVAPGLGLGPLFAWLTARVRMPLMPAALLFGGAIVPLAGAWTAAEVVAVIAYAATMGLVLGSRRAERDEGPPPGGGGPPG